MKIQIDIDRPWLGQLQEVKETLVRKALEETKGNQLAASKLLGCTSKTIRNSIKRDPTLREFTEDREYNKDSNRENMVKFLFEFSYSAIEISEKTNVSITTVRRILRYTFGEKDYKRQNKLNNYSRKQRSMGMLNTDEILNNNHLILEEITKKIKENRIDELTEENLFYAKILFNNGFITKDGTVTKEGIDALYH